MTFHRPKPHQIRSPKYIKRIKRLMRQWAKIADKLNKKADKTWKDLKTGKLQQFDEIIYSVYQDSSSANALERCICDLEQLLDEVE